MNSRLYLLSLIIMLSLPACLVVNEQGFTHLTPDELPPFTEGEAYALEVGGWLQERAYYCGGGVPGEEYLQHAGPCMTDYAKECLGWMFDNDPADCAYLDVDCLPDRATGECDAD